MANPHKEQRRREAANEGGLHESRESRHQDWTRLDDDREEGGDQHHHRHHHHHHGGESQQSDRDYEQLAENVHSRIRGNEGSRQGHDSGRTDREHTNRYGSRSANDPGTSRSPGTESRQSSGHGGQSRSHGGQSSSDRRYGKRREQRGRQSREQGTPHEGSQRGSHSEGGISGRMTGQRSEATHHSDPSDSTFRSRTTGQREHRHGGEQGTSERDRRYGSRRGHGSERRTDDRHSSH